MVTTSWTDSIGLHGDRMEEKLHLSFDGEKFKDEFVGVRQEVMVLVHLLRFSGCLNKKYINSISKKINAIISKLVVF